MILIGITGQARSGKDTTADLIATNENDFVTAFANPIKAGVRAIFNGGPEHTDGKYKETKIPGFGFTWRKAMQTLGTEWGREQDKDIWLKIVAEKYRAHQEESPGGVYFVVSDVRFDNEAEWIRDNGGYIIKTKRGMGVSVEGHSSENGINPALIDVVVNNNGTLESLEQHVDAALSYINAL